MDDQQTTLWSMDRVIAIIRDLARDEDLPEHLTTASIKPEDTVETLGFDSLGAVSLVERLEAELGLPLPDDFLDFSDDIAGIARRMGSLARGEG